MKFLQLILFLGCVLWIYSDKALSLPNKSLKTIIFDLGSGVNETIPLGKSKILTDGTQIRADGTIIWTSGLKLQRIWHPNGSFLGIQYILPDGRRMKAGQEAILDNGAKIVQPDFYNNKQELTPEKN